MAIFKNLEANSNLGYTSEMTVDVETKSNDTVEFEFSTGFKATAKLIDQKDDWEGNLICIYSYRVPNNETHHLHMRILKDGGIYFQTVQTGLNPGGSTFNTLEKQ